MSENAGKSGRQDSSLSARRARLRALAQQPGALNNTAAAQEKDAKAAEVAKSSEKSAGKSVEKLVLKSEVKPKENSFEFYPQQSETEEPAEESQAAPEPVTAPIIEEPVITQEATVTTVASPPKEIPLPEPEKEEKPSAPVSSPANPADNPQINALVLLGSVESSLNVCAMNLSQLVKTSSDQSEALITLRDLIQNQTFFEIGLNLNTLLDSLSAALEPMKAVGELVPSIDQLVATMETRSVMGMESAPSKVSPDQLLMNLSNQLASGEIDPWTFKSAYMAVYPDDHPADLLHRLVELLGTQRLSGTLFRAAYDAVQAAEAPSRGGYGFDEISGNDRELLGRIEELTQTNRELQELLDGRSVDVSRKVEEVEEEYAEILASKEQELQEMQDTLSLRIEEFNSRFEELESTAKTSKDALTNKEEETKAKEDELKRKEEDIALKASEIAQLRQQLTELQDQFRDTVSDLQKQLTSVKQASADIAKQASVPAQSVAIQPHMQPHMQPQIQPQITQSQPMLQQPTQQAQPQPQPMMQQPDPAKSKPASTGGFFDSNQEMRQAQTQGQLNQQMDTFNSMSRIPASEPAYSQPNVARQSTGYGAAPPTTPLPSGSGGGGGNVPPGMGGGSYGNGVRAQVFEVIVRQALAGAPWREICAGPMQVNSISADEVEAEVKKRQDMLR